MGEITPDPVPIAALKNTVVLETLFSRVPAQDLKNARAVVKLWRDESLDNFRKSLVYVLDPKTESERLLKVTLGIGTKEGGDDGLYRFQDQPFKNYKLVMSNEFPPTDMESYEEKRYFWELCSPHVAYLDLEDRSFFPMLSYIDGLIWLFQNCSKLEKLRFFPVWSPNARLDFGNDDDGLGVHLAFDFDQRVKSIGILRKLPIAISESDLAKIQKNPACNMKALSIPFSTATVMNREETLGYLGLYWNRLAEHDHDYRSRYRTFWWCVLSFMPNLKALQIERMYLDVMEALLAGSLTTGKLIKLETFIFSSGNLYPILQFRLEPLLLYLEQLEKTGGFLKNLTLKQIAAFHFWEHPKAFRNVVFRIRKRIEKFHFGFKKSIGRPHLQEQSKFDLFNFIFPNLTDLTLEFDYDDYAIFLFFDFSTFRGTPNLTRFRMKYCNVCDWPTGRMPLATTYLTNGGPGEKWHLLEAVKANEAKEDMQILQGDGDETFDPAGRSGIKWEDEIILEKMKEFHFTERFTTKAILVLGKWMKNLKEFAIIFDDETIFIPFVVWPGTLKKLTVLQPSSVGPGHVTEKSISELRGMYPEVEIVLED